MATLRKRLWRRLKMGMTAKIVKRGKGLQNLADNIRIISQQTLEVGHFDEQGYHSEADHLKLVDLMRIHHAGFIKGTVSVPPRPILNILKSRAKKLSNSKQKAAFKKWLSSEMTREDHRQLLEALGESLVEVEKAIFGASPPLATNASGTVKAKGFNSPMIETGELKERVAYRSSLDKRIVE